MRSGVIWYKAAGESAAAPAKPIRVNITIWVFIDILPWLEKLNKVTRRNAHAPPKKVKETFEQTYGAEGREIMKLFDVVLDCSQFSNLEIMGSRFLKYQENFILEAFALHLEGSDRILSRPSEKDKDLLYDFRELKCICQNLKRSDKLDHDKSIGESFIQYYYLCQRRIHSEVEMQCQ